MRLKILCLMVCIFSGNVFALTCPNPSDFTHVLKGEEVVFTDNNNPGWDVTLSYKRNL